MAEIASIKSSASLNVYQNLTDYMSEVEDLFRAAAPKNTGKLSNSVKANLIKTETGFSVSVEMEDYGYYQDAGVNGVGYNQTKAGKADRRFKVNKSIVTGSPFSFRDKRPPASAFASYTSNIGEQYAIANSVYKRGIKPKNFIKPVADKVELDIAKYLEEDIMVYLNIEIDEL
jgi:hypothetical protein